MLVVAASILVGCFEYQPVGRIRDGQNLPPSTRVTLYTGRIVTFASSRMVNDTIVGFELGSSRRTEVALAAVDRIETKRLDGKHTMITVGVVAAAVFLVTRVAAISGDLSRPTTNPLAPARLP